MKLRFNFFIFLHPCIFSCFLLLSIVVSGQRTFCNPLNISYRFQLTQPSRRTAADPVVVLYKDNYYLFATASGGYWYSGDLLDWTFMTTKDLPFEKDAPAVTVINGSLYYLAMASHTIYKTDDPLSGKWDIYNDSFPMGVGDPDIFQDTDGKVYLYFGCTNNDYLQAVELDVKNKLDPIGQPVKCFRGQPLSHGWERPGDYNTSTENPWTEAPWMTKHDGKYYYQYSAPGTQYKSYADGYYVSDKPLGPFRYAELSPFSAKPEGFIDGAGHSATFQDKFGNYWHISTLTISVKDIFERRLGLFPVTFDPRGDMITHTEFGDYPMVMPDHKIRDLSELYPGWMLLSYHKAAEASSTLAGHPAAFAVDENVRDYWSAGTGNKGEWLCVDLGAISTVRAVQLDFAENDTHLTGRDNIPAQQYLLEYSDDKNTWKTLVDKTGNQDDLTHQYHPLTTPVKTRYLRVTNYRVPDGTFALSGFRVFGYGAGKKPGAISTFKALRDSGDPRNVTLTWKMQRNAIGYNIRFGVQKNELNRVYQVYGDTTVTIRSLNKDDPYWFAIDAFGENGVTKGITLVGPSTSGRLVLPGMFSDHMVLQQHRKAAVWGWSAPGRKVVIRAGWGSGAAATAGADGKWLAWLSTPSAGGPFTISVRNADTSVIIHDVLIGEVWLASGQSNMDIPLRGWPPGDTILNSKAEISHAHYPKIRVLKVPFGTAPAPLDSLHAKWVVISPETAGDFSATAYFFARSLYQTLHIPVGILQSSIGGTPVEAWTSGAYLSRAGDFGKQLAGLQTPDGVSKINSNTPSVLFNAMIHPLLPFSIRGVIWYQGESNVGRAQQYKRLFPLQINDWRREWGYELPFYFVQLAPNLYTAPDQKGQAAKLRDAQRAGLQLPRTGMVSTLDIGYLRTAHPPNKQAVGQRLARLALANEYGRKVVASGPLYDKSLVSRKEIALRFRSTGSGLMAGPGGLYNFEIAGPDRHYVAATARIVNDRVIVSAPSVDRPAYARYAWSDSGRATLFNRQGLPAATFTTDTSAMALQ